jgi:uncharacterized protein (TIGR03435 family)
MFLSVVLAAQFALNAQQPASAGDVHHFAVASIRPTPADRASIKTNINPNSFSLSASLGYFIQYAYQLTQTDVVGGPEWVRSDGYEILAKAQGPQSPEEIRLMLQSLLAERFQLRLHMEQRTVRGYALTRDGKLRLSHPSESLPAQASRIRVAVGRIGLIRGRDASMQDLARALTSEVKIPVQDDSNLTGTFDFDIPFARPDSTSQATEKEDYPELFTALHQVGLKLVSRSLDRRVAVIDAVSRPSAN